MATATMVPNTFVIEPFCPTSTTWSRWLMRLEGAFRIFTIKNEARVPYLLHYVGPASFDIVCNQLAPQDPFEATYITLTKTLGDFYEPAPLEIVENYKFHQRKQKEGESIQEFLAALQKLCLHCKFGEYVKTALRNQLVFGLISKKIQARLLELPDLTLEKATQVATAMEISDKGTQQLQGETSEYQDITSPTVAKIKNVQAKLTLKENAKPIFCKARPVPFRLRTQIEEELLRLETEGILIKVDTAEWAIPIVPVLKKNGQICICGDFSVTLNAQLIVDDHLLPTADELFASMAGGVIFSKIDLLQAYLQMEVRPEDRHLLTLNTHKGLYRCTRLMYGIASVPAIWQRTIESILGDIPGVAVFLDDIRIAGSSVEDHLRTLELVFTRLQKYNIRINPDKSEFFARQINYCGYVIDKNGLHKALDKIKAIEGMRGPQNVTEQTLLQYRNAKHNTTGKSPAELMFNRKLRTRLDLLLKIANLARLHYKVKLDDGRIWKRHVNQMREIGENTLPKPTDYSSVVQKESDFSTVGDTPTRVETAN
ncbi:uncharacterized protein LOC143305547 [Osmia lignaria lignaria]|uniref:uncharacterized protein LOC143305547 n=1 Tax=Osmia lignaria lignaria TaxID=1437193 RepID=UPI00402B38FD